MMANEACNKWPDEDAGNCLQGGTGLIAFQEMCDLVKKSNNDFRRLGWWSSWLLYINKGNRLRVLVAYTTGRPKREGLKTVYQQQLAYIQDKGLKSNPMRMFETDFHAALRVWRSQGDRLLVIMDAYGC